MVVNMFFNTYDMRSRYMSRIMTFVMINILTFKGVLLRLHIEGAQT